MKLQIKKSISFMLLIGTLILLNSCEEDANFRTYEYPEQSVTDFSPMTARPTQEITINGSNFGVLRNAVTVYFNNVAVPAANILTVEDTKIVVTVPDNATSGKVSVKVWTFTKDVPSGDFIFIPGGQITGVTPLLGLEGDTVTITGKNFGTKLGDIKVSFGGVYGAVVSVIDTEIKVKIPKDGVTGTLNIYVGLQKVDAGFFLVDAEKISGTVIGTPGSWNNNTATTINAAFDGNTTTFVDGTGATAYFMGYDFGATTTATLKAVRYFPRAGFPARMLNGKFYGTNDLAKVGTNTGTLLGTIATTPVNNAWNQLVISETANSFRYIYYYNDSAGNGNNVAEIEFYGKKK